MARRRWRAADLVSFLGWAPYLAFHQQIADQALRSRMPTLFGQRSLISVAILLAAGLSFLGLGVEPPTPDWGLMLSTLRQAIYVQPYVCALPGLAIFITSLSFNLVSDGLRQAMDVRI